MLHKMFIQSFNTYVCINGCYYFQAAGTQRWEQDQRPQGIRVYFVCVWIRDHTTSPMAPEGSGGGENNACKIWSGSAGAECEVPWVQGGGSWVGTPTSRLSLSPPTQVIDRVVLMARGPEQELLLERPLWEALGRKDSKASPGPRLEKGCEACRAAGEPQGPCRGSPLPWGTVVL